MIKISISKGNMKTGRIPAFSLPPEITCPGACKGCKDKCYAKKAFRMYPGVRAAWEANYEAAEALDHIPQIMDYLKKHKPRFFRIHVSGDFFSAQYFTQWCGIAMACPGTRFLAFTKSPASMLKAMRPSNFTLVRSIWGAKGERRGKYAGFAHTVLPGEDIPADALECPGNCQTCNACWGLAKGKAVAFRLH